MAIPVRVPPKQEQRETRPTRGEVEVAAATFASLFKDLKPTFADELTDFATKSVATCLAAIAYARHLIRCYVAEAKLKKQSVEVAEQPLRDFVEALREAREKDTATKDPARTLSGIPQGRPLKMGVKERAVVVSKIKPLFAAPPKTPVEGELPHVIVGAEGSFLRLGDWLIRKFLDEAELAEYEAELAKAREADQADRRTPSGDAESGTEAEEESDKDPSDTTDDNGNGTTELAPAAS